MNLWCVRRALFFIGACAAMGSIRLLAGLERSSASDSLRKLKSFQTTGTVLYVAAHPNDENSV